MGAVDVGLKASLNKLSAECNDVSDISIKYYATDLPGKLPTTLEGLVSLIEEFPSRLKGINDGKGIPMQVRFSSATVTKLLERTVKPVLSGPHIKRTPA